jgi:hypothetical protein
MIKKLKKFNLYEYGSENPMIFIEATDPDDACNKVFYQLANILLKQDSSAETLSLIREMLFEIKITKIRIPDEQRL